MNVKETIDDLLGAYVAGIVVHVDGVVSMPIEVCERVLRMATGNKALMNVVSNLGKAHEVAQAELDVVRGQLRAARETGVRQLGEQALSQGATVVDTNTIPLPFGELPIPNDAAMVETLFGTTTVREVSDNEMLARTPTVFTRAPSAAPAARCDCPKPSYVVSGVWVCPTHKAVRGAA